MPLASPPVHTGINGAKCMGEVVLQKTCISKSSKIIVVDGCAFTKIQKVAQKIFKKQNKNNKIILEGALFILRLILLVYTTNMDRLSSSCW